MQIRLFLNEAKKFKSDANLKDLANFKNENNFAFFLTTNEADFQKSLDLCINLNKSIQNNLKHKLVIDSGYIIENLTILHFEKKNVVKTGLKIFLTNNFISILDKSNSPIIRQAFEKIFKENHLIQESPVVFYCAVINKILDSYYAITDSWSDDIASAEIKILEKKSDNTSLELADMRKKIIYIRSNIQDLINQLEKIQETESKLFSGFSRTLEQTIKRSYFLRNSIETLNGMIINLYNLYLADLSAKQNEINKTLTIVATIFMPASFITGFFGMNFTLPFLEHEYAYFACTGLILISFVCAVLYFRKKKWI